MDSSLNLNRAGYIAEVYALIWFIFLLFLSGVVAGLAFTVQTLLGLLAIIIVHYPIAALAGVGLEAPTVLGGLVAAQIGYFAGVLGRGALEWIRLGWRGTHKPRVP